MNQDGVVVVTIEARYDLPAEPGSVDRHSARPKRIFGEIVGKAVGVVEFEGSLARKRSARAQV